MKNELRSGFKKGLIDIWVEDFLLNEGDHFLPILCSGLQEQQSKKVSKISEIILTLQKLNILYTPEDFVSNYVYKSGRDISHSIEKLKILEIEQLFFLVTNIS